MWCSRCGSAEHYVGRCPELPARAIAVVNIPGMVVNKDVVVVNRKGDRHRITEKRKAYMRDYMRRRRAKGEPQPVQSGH